jgi:hypothetical protein
MKTSFSLYYLDVINVVAVDAGIMVVSILIPSLIALQNYVVHYFNQNVSLLRLRQHKILNSLFPNYSYLYALSY